MVYDRNARRQRFISTAEVREPITAYYSGSGKKLFTLGERGDRPVAHIFDLKTFRRKKTLLITSTDITFSKEYISLQLSEDETYLLALTSGPDYTLVGKSH